MRTDHSPTLHDVSLLASTDPAEMLRAVQCAGHGKESSACVFEHIKGDGIDRLAAARVRSAGDCAVAGYYHRLLETC